ncbi:uncharacterized protein si:dkey-197j19.6 [Sardina pilchardus]|uniref:uncharacterized protein si:dkey-197j19.6 n=1 Tax=Sardina pilchardus TaxID=27697 RepID=UPI002E141B97
MSRSGLRVFSTYLSTRENGLLVRVIGADCSILASAVVQLVLVSPAQKGQRLAWEVHSCGVACLVQDRNVHSAFIRIYCVKKAKLLWEQEVYTPFKYSAPHPYFHSFPGDDCYAGLNFADEEEAAKFLSAVQTYVNSCITRPHLLRQDSSPGRLLWENRSKSQLSSPTDNVPSPASPQRRLAFTFPPDVTTRKQVEQVLSKPSPHPPHTLPKPKRESLPLAIRKGPLPSVPVHANKVYVGIRNRGSENAQSSAPGSPLSLPHWVPPPPSHQAPKPPGYGLLLSKDTGPRALTGRDAFSMKMTLHYRSQDLW